jgi:hypothetical protein
MIQNDSVSIKYRMPDGTTNTIWVPIAARVAVAVAAVTVAVAVAVAVLLPLLTSPTAAPSGLS